MFFDFLTSLKKFLRRLGDYQKCCIDILQSENLGVFRKMFSGILCVLVSKIKRSRDEITNFRQLTNVWVSLDPSIADYYSRSEIALCVSHASRAARSFVTESTAERSGYISRVTACRQTFYYLLIFLCFFRLVLGRF